MTMRRARRQCRKGLYAIWKKVRVFYGGRTANVHCSATVAALKCELTWGPSQGCRELLTIVVPI